MPRRPRRTDSKPSCMSPPALRLRSSQWSMTGRSRARAYSMARRITRRVHHRPAVVGDGHDAGVLHGADGREFLARAALGDGADGEDVDHARSWRARSMM